MKPAPFTYHRPASVREALELLRHHGDDAKALAGGQSLVPLLALRLASPAHLVDIARIGALGEIDVRPAAAGAPAALTIGATVTQRAAERDPRVRRFAPLLADALPHIAHPQIRARGTVCGSLAHADPAAELPAVALALDAVLVVAAADGMRRVPAADFFRSYLDTALEADELLVAVELPIATAPTGAAFCEVSRRDGDFAMVGAGAVLTLAPDGRVGDARVVLTGVATTPRRVRAAEDAVRGVAPGPAFAAAVAEAASLAARAVDPPADIHATAAYRRHLVRVLTARCLDTAAQTISSGPARSLDPGAPR